MAQKLSQPCELESQKKKRFRQLKGRRHEQHLCMIIRTLPLARPLLLLGVWSHECHVVAITLSIPVQWLFGWTVHDTSNRSQHT